MVNDSPSIMVATRKPPPPRFPLLDDVTESANPTVTAASMAFPPFFKISIPASEACLLVETTIPFSLNTGSELAAGANVEKIMYKIISVICLFIIRV